MVYQRIFACQSIHISPLHGHTREGMNLEMNLKRMIKGLYGITLIELGCLSAVLCESVLKRGEADIIVAVGGIVIFVLGYIGSVYGFYYWRVLKESKNILAMFATVINAVLCVLMLVSYVLGCLF